MFIVTQSIYFWLSE